MSIHIAAKQGEIASTVLLPGDPLRAKYVAENFLEKVRCYNEVRGMLGFTGEYKGKRISVQGSGMGLPSLSIYVHELFSEYHVSRIIRIGTCGSIQPDLKVMDVILAQTASTDSHINKLRFRGMDYAPAATFTLLQAAWLAAEARKIPVRVGNILSTDVFYQDEPEAWKLWAEYGVLGLEMESNGLYTLAAKFKAEALSVLTVSDNILTGEMASSEQRERMLNQMIEIALEVG